MKTASHILMVLRMDTDQKEENHYDTNAEWQDVLSWHDIDLYGKTLPEYTDEAIELIETYLGYGVKYEISIPHEPFIRVLIQQHKSGAISKQEFHEGVSEHVKHIRNIDMKVNGWIKEYTEGNYSAYNSRHMYLKEAARERLAMFLGYIPSIEHSLFAELIVRDLMAKDSFRPDWGLTPYDYHAITIIKYREVLFSEGYEAADQSPVWGEID